MPGTLSAPAKPDATLRLLTTPRFNCDFPFAFKVNGGKNHWTPETLESQHGITNFGRLREIHIEVTGQNIAIVHELMVWWAEYPIVLCFPKFREQPEVGDSNDPQPFGLDGDECYELVRGRWVATHDFRKAMLDSCDESDVEIRLSEPLNRHT